MDFISNLIKRPISLVLNETSPTTDKFGVSASSLPNNLPSALDLHQTDTVNEKHNQLLSNNNNNNNNNRPLSMSSSFNGGNITDFIGVPDEFLVELEEFLPPPPPLTQSSPYNMSTDNRSLSLTPPPPPLPLPLTSSMKASLTIDELLLEISDNLQQAGLHDDVLAIASPPNAELSPLSSKAALNNSKTLTSTSNSSSATSTTKIHTPKAANNSQAVTAAAGSAATVFEANSSIHKFHIDPELETSIFDDHQQQLHNNSGVNKSSNKFVGLTEFDEAKIPELPGDLNPNIEEQYSVTFEKCFIPTLNTQQGIKADEFVVDKTHLLLPTETDTAVSSDNETFADCQDEDRDPLATTFAETASNLDTTTDLESYQSANNNTLNVEHNNTLDNIVDLTMEADEFDEEPPKNHIVEELSQQQPQQHEVMDEDEPMDIDMNRTMEILQSSASNIQHVEKVLQHAENILQHIEEKRPLDEKLAKQNESSTMTFMVNSPQEDFHDGSQYLEIEQSKHELSLNKSIELPVKETKTECIIATVNKAEEVTEEIAPAKLETEIENVPSALDSNKSMNNNNLTLDCMMNSSTSSNTSSKSPAKNLNLTMGLTTSLTSQSSSGPNSPSFPMKPSQIAGFPRSPMAVKNNPQQTPFLEKSDYLENPPKSVRQTECDLPTVVDNLNGTYVESLTQNELPPQDVNKCNGTFVESITQNQLPSEDVNNFNGTFVESQTTGSQNQLPSEDVNNFNGTFVEPTPPPTAASSDELSTMANQLNGTYVEAFSTSSLQKDTCQTLDVDTLMLKDTEDLTTTPDLNLDAQNVNNEDLVKSSQPDKKRLTFAVNSEEVKDQDSTDFNIPSSQDISQTIGVDSLSDNKTLDNLNVSKENRRTFSVDSTSMNSRRTFNVASEPTAMDTSFEPMDVDDTVSQNSTMPTTMPAPKPEASPMEQLLQQSPPLPTMQHKSQSPPLPTMQQRSQSPPTITMRERSQSPPSPPMPRTLHKPIPIKEEPISPLPETSSFTSQQPFPIIQKRPSIHDHAARMRGDTLSLKEQSTIKVKDEKDILVEKFIPSPIEDIFTAVSATSTTLTNSSGLSEFDQTSSSTSLFNNGEQQQQQQFDDAEFQGNNNLIFDSSDFDYLLTKGNNNTPVDRSSLLLKFDPLLGVPVPVNQGQQQQPSQQLQQLQQLQIPTNIINSCLSPTLEEDEHNDSNRSFVIETKPTGLQGAADATSAKLLKERSQDVKQQLQLEQQLQQQYKRQLSQGGNKKNATMSVDVIKDMSLDNDCNKTFENSNSTQSDDKQINYKMDELEKKIKNEVVKTEDIEKKLKDAEQREEALIKRITEKDKTVSKMNGVIEAYEKAIAELIAEKEQLIQNYEKQLAEVKADRDSNYHHLTSLETTFSDLHVKYEKSKEMTCQLKSNEDSLVTENRKTLENLRLQEQRYDKMKNHAIQQLEIANKKLESQTRDHAIESTKLKALLKKEEIARSSINEQLTQKTKENAELVKICDELISGQGS